MKKYLEINKKFIIRETDKMIFSAKDMKIFKFNDKGFKLVNTIAKSNYIEEEKLFNILSNNYSKEEFEQIIKKMLDNKIIIIKEKQYDF